MAYPSRFFTDLFLHTIIASVMILVWSLIYKEKEIIDGYTFNAFATYMALSIVIRAVTANGGVANSYSKHIRKGSLSYWLVKPASFNQYHFFRASSWRLTKIVIPAIFFILLLLTKPGFFLTPHLPILFLVSLLLGMMINFFIYALIGSIGFWTINVWGIISIFGRVADVLSGALFPLDFLPKSIATGVSYLPFKYMHYAPLSIYLGKEDTTGSLQLILIQLGWIMGLGVVYRFVWARGLKRYDSVGN